MKQPQTGPMQFPGQLPGIYIDRYDAMRLLHGRMGELKRIVRQCYQPDNPSAPVQQARMEETDDDSIEARLLEGVSQ